jgi:hypothetical protein
LLFLAFLLKVFCTVLETVSSNKFSGLCSPFRSF